MPVLFVREGYGSQNVGFQRYINYWRDGEVIENSGIPEDDPDRWEHTYIPFVRLRYLIDGIINTTDLVQYIIGEYQSDDIQDLLLFNNYALDRVYNYNNESAEPVRKNGYKGEINLPEHVPDISGLELFSNFLNHFNYYLDFQGNTLVVRPKEEKMNRPAIDWTTKVEYGFSKNIPEKYGYTLVLADEENDRENIDGQLDDYISEPGENEINLPFSTLNTFDQNVFGSDYWRLPTIRQNLSSDELGIGQKDYALRLFFDRGLQNDSDGKPYQMATNSYLDVANNPVGNQSLILNGEKGLHNQNWKKYASVIFNEVHSFACRLTISDLLKLKKWEDFRIIIKHPKGQFEGYIKTVKIKATETGLSLAKIDFIRAI